jgi:hypothetical protein
VKATDDDDLIAAVAGDDAALWPLRGSTDRGVLACGLSLLIAGAAVATVRGARESAGT